MTKAWLKEVKGRVRAAAATDNAKAALAVCHTIIDYDLFIAESRNLEGKVVGLPKVIVNRYVATCQGCGHDIGEGATVIWVDGEGCWHLGCWPADRATELEVPCQP